MDSAETDISICICTFKRPEMLGQLLSTICQKLELPGSVELIVVDNDKNQSARGVVEKHLRGPLPVHYLVEPEQNIAVARNKAVSVANGKWIAMIDDDELPAADWLVAFYKCAQACDAEAVFGPVEPVYEEGCPQWIIDGRFFERPRFSTGAEVGIGNTRTSNVILRRDLISDGGEAFDPAFGLSGGSDSLLFDGLLLEGRQFYWCDEAVVSEFIPAERATWRWLLQRSFRGGQTVGRLMLCGYGKDRPSTVAKLLFLCGSVMKCFVALAFSIATLPFGRARWFRWLRVVCVQLGKASAFTPYIYLEYARPQ